MPVNGTSGTAPMLEEVVTDRLQYFEERFLKLKLNSFLILNFDIRCLKYLTEIYPVCSETERTILNKLSLSKAKGRNKARKDVY